MNQEHERFLTLFDALVEANNAWLNKTPRAKWDWVPFDNPNMKFGDRISTITIKSVYIHTLVGECGWSRMLRDCPDGAVIGPDHEEGRALTGRLNEAADLVGEAMKLHGENMRRFRAFEDAQLQKKIRWSGRDWTVMGFLWGIYSHRSYHLGNIDIFMREADEPAPDFFSNFRQVMA